MKATKILPELLIGGIVVIPLVYLLYLWNSLPAEIPIHFDAVGNPNNYGTKYYLMLSLLFLTIGTYLFLLFVPKIDPKKNFSIFSTTFMKLRVALALFFSAISFIIIFSAKEAVLNTSYFYFVFALLVVIIGNYMSNIRPNYFVGIRTPWTLENSKNWKETHHITGRLWFVAGLCLAVLMLTLPQAYSFVVFIAVMFVIALFPVLFSFYKYRTVNK